jgi:hypothetical protein
MEPAEVETNKGAAGMDLDAAIKGVAAQMETRIPSKTIQVLNANGGLAMSCISFTDGAQNWASHGYTASQKYRVRPVRQF